MNNYWAFAPMRASNELLGDRAALRKRMDEEGYLYLRGLVDERRIGTLRSEMLAVLRDHGWTRADHLGSARPRRPPVREGDDEYFEVYDEIQKLESFHSLAHDDALMEVMREALGDTAFPHPLKVARLAFPGAPEVSTPPHQDYVNNQGTQKLTAAWIPVGDCPMEHGTLAVLRGSNRFGVLPLKFHLGAGNRRAVLPAEMQERLPWVTTDMTAGDVLLFGALTVHAALNNATFDMRLSVDFRYQPQGEELTELVLEPHFGRLRWEEIYGGWQSDELKYYWRDLDYRVVPYDTSEFEASEPSEEEIIRVLVYEEFRERRHRRQSKDSASDRVRPDAK
jgi:ectoine hydroxylase-related dioxygenase (phytanoyl-CoA dioxygenase family)